MSLLSDVASHECFCYMELILLYMERLGSKFVWLRRRCADIWRQVSSQDLFHHINVSKFVLYFGISCLLCHSLQERD
jgi:hypothetical protein